MLTDELARDAERRLLARVDATAAAPPDGFPHAADPATGRWGAKPGGAWTDGFWVGLLWLAHAATGAPRYRAWGLEWAERLRRPRAAGEPRHRVPLPVRRGAGLADRAGARPPRAGAGGRRPTRRHVASPRASDPGRLPRRGLLGRRRRHDRLPDEPPGPLVGGGRDGRRPLPGGGRGPRGAHGGLARAAAMAPATSPCTSIPGPASPTRSTPTRGTRRTGAGRAGSAGARTASSRPTGRRAGGTSSTSPDGPSSTTSAGPRRTP